jgi:hypothetical protein
MARRILGIKAALGDFQAFPEAVQEQIITALRIAARGEKADKAKGRSMHGVEAHEAMKPRLLQQAIDEGLASGPSDRSMEELIADAEGEAADGPTGMPDPVADVHCPPWFRPASAGYAVCSGPIRATVNDDQSTPRSDIWSR